MVKADHVITICRVLARGMLVLSVLYTFIDTKSGLGGDPSFLPPTQFDNGYPVLERPLSATTFEVVYTSDTFRNTRGGRKVGTGYSGLVDLVSTTDLEKLGMENVGGNFVLHGLNKHGPGLNPFVGSTQSTNIDAAPFTAVGEYFWERQWSDGDILTRFGRQVGARQFSILDLAADYTYGGFQRSPNNPLPWYPNPSVGSTVDMRLTENLHLAAGSYANAQAGQLTSWGFSGDGTQYSLGQLKNSYSIGNKPGDLQLGLWYLSGSHLNPSATNISQGDYGVYTGWDQLLLSEDGDPEQGLGTFFIYSWAPSDRNRITNHFATGLVYRGLFASRSSDIAGVGISIAQFSDELVGFKTEQTTEAFYKVHVTSTTIVQPALHYITNPGGINRVSLDVGLRIGFER